MEVGEQKRMKKEKKEGKTIVSEAEKKEGKTIEKEAEQREAKGIEKEAEKGEIRKIEITAEKEAGEEASKESGHAEGEASAKEPAPEKGEASAKEPAPAEGEASAKEPAPEKGEASAKKPGQEPEAKPEEVAGEGTEAEAEAGNAKKAGKGKWIVLALVLVSLVSLTTAYFCVAGSYRNRFLPASTINGIDCGDLDAAEVSARLTPSVDDYSLEVRGRDFATGQSGAVLGRISASDVDMRYEGIFSSVEDALAQQNEYRWIFSYLANETASYSVAVKMSYDEEKAKSCAGAWDAFQAGNMRDSEYAYISGYSEATNSYQVIPKTVSTRINLGQAYEYIVSALYEHKTELDIEELGCYEDAAADQDLKKLNDTVDTANKWLKASVTYDWNGTQVVLDKEQLREWITIVDDEPVLDTEQIKRFVKKRAAENDTYGKNGNFTTAHGVTLSLYRGSYGWKTDVAAEAEELEELIRQGSNVNREPIYSISAKAKGKNDIGNSYVEIDLTHQHLYLNIEGETVLESDFVSGNMSAGNATPPGIFGLTYKKTDAVLRGADYETPVNYWMPFYGNYGMHDATWRRVFGGSIYLTGGSHGCINLPLEKAEEIYQYMSKGFPVICYYYEVDPLAAPEPPAAVPAPPGEAQGAGTGQAGSEAQGTGTGQAGSEDQGAGTMQAGSEVQEAGAVQPEGIGEGTGE